MYLLTRAEEKPAGDGSWELATVAPPWRPASQLARRGLARLSWEPSKRGCRAPLMAIIGLKSPELNKEHDSQFY